MITRRRRTITGGVLTAIVAALAVLAGLGTYASLAHAGNRTAVISAATPRPSVISRPPVTYHAAASVPVLVYHEMNNGCPPSARTCVAADPETVSTAQFYLVKAGYHTVTLSQYERWLAHPRTRLPARPVLLTADNGIGNFLTGAQPILARDGFTMTAFIVTGFADGAAGHCAPPASTPDGRFNVQPGCGPQNRGWDMTWPQLAALSPAVYSFALEAGPSGHFVQNYNQRCPMFDACLLPGETRAGYESRVRAENAAGLSELQARLGSRVNRSAWVVPYSDLGYPQCASPDCTPQDSDGPHGWLQHYAAVHFGAVFVEDAVRNGIRRERFRDDINGSFTERHFETLLHQFTAAGDFARTHRKG
jgi:hypothetical protein